MITPPCSRFALLAGLACAGCAGVPARPASAPPEAVLVGRGVVSTPDWEGDATFSPDGNTVFYTKSSRQPQIFSAIVFSRRLRGAWTTPQVAPFSGMHSDLDPSFSPDGSRLFFASSRPVNGKPKPLGEYDLWVVERTAGGGWSEPRRLDAPVNSDAVEGSPSVTADGTLYFASTRPGGKGSLDLWRARWANGRYAEPENLGDSINTPGPDRDVWVSTDGGILLWATVTGTPPAVNEDVFMSRSRNGTWTAAKKLGNPVNSEFTDNAPSLSRDGRYLFFASSRGSFAAGEKRLTFAEFMERMNRVENHLGNIFRVDAVVLP